MWLYGPFSGPGDGDGEVVYCPVCDKDNEHLVEVWPSEAREPALPLCCKMHLRDTDLTLDPAANGQDGPLVEARCFVTHPYPEDMGEGEDQEVNSARSRFFMYFTLARHFFELADPNARATKGRRLKLPTCVYAEVAMLYGRSQKGYVGRRTA